MCACFPEHSLSATSNFLGLSSGLASLERLLCVGLVPRTPVLVLITAGLRGALALPGHLALSQPLLLACPPCLHPQLMVMERQESKL